MKTVRTLDYLAYLPYRQRKDHAIDRLRHHPPLEKTEIAAPLRLGTDGNRTRHLTKILSRLQSFQDSLRTVPVADDDLCGAHSPLR